MRAVSLSNSLLDSLAGFDSGLSSIIRASQFGPPVRLASEPQTLRFPIDAKETESAYVVYANLPGVSKDNIHIEIDGAQVKISASTATSTLKNVATNTLASSSAEAASPTAPTADETLIRRERVTGQFERQFKLAQEIEADQVIAKLELGVLELTLPKKVAPSGKKIVVQ